MHSTFQKMGMRVLLSHWALRLEVILQAGQDEAHPHIEMLSRCTIPLNDSGNGFVILDYGRSIEAPNPTQRLFHVVICLGQGNQSELVVFKPHHFQRSRNSTIVIEEDPAVVVSQLRFFSRLDYHAALEVKTGHELANLASSACLPPRRSTILSDRMVSQLIDLI